jgi:hypothetical protein
VVTMSHEVTKRTQNKPPLLITRIALFVFVVALVLVFLILRGHGSAGVGRCPIDGQPSEWSRNTTENVCEFGHYSNVEKTSHHWFGVCP